MVIRLFQIIPSCTFDKINIICYEHNTCDFVAIQEEGLKICSEEEIKICSEEEIKNGNKNILNSNNN